jgi:hypothetical protein
LIVWGLWLALLHKVLFTFCPIFSILGCKGSKEGTVLYLDQGRRINFNKLCLIANLLVLLFNAKINIFKPLDFGFLFFEVRVLSDFLNALIFL